MIYLACPYSNNDPEVREQRYQAANRAAAYLIKRGHTVFSPISHSHILARDYGLGLGYESWKKLSQKILPICNKLVILEIPGWEISTGVVAEIAMAEACGITIETVGPI